MGWSCCTGWSAGYPFQSGKEQGNIYKSLGITDGSKTTIGQASSFKMPLMANFVICSTLEIPVSMRFGYPLLSKLKTCSALGAACPAGGNTPVTGHPGSTLPTLPRKELREYYGLGVSALPTHIFQDPTPAVAVARIWWGRLWRIGVRFLRDRCSHRRVRRGRGGKCGGLSGFRVVLCLSVSFSFGGGVGLLDICAVSGWFDTLSGWVFPRIVSFCIIYIHAASVAGPGPVARSAGALWRVSIMVRQRCWVGKGLVSWLGAS